MAKKRHYDPLWLIKVYQYTRDGITSKSEMARLLGITYGRFRKLLACKQVLRDAIQLGVDDRNSDKPGDGLKKYVYNCLTPQAREVWNNLMELRKQCKGRKGWDNRAEFDWRNITKAVKQQVFLHAIIYFGYNPSKACEFTGVSKFDIVNWCNRHPEFKDLYDQIKWHLGNFYESALVKAVRRGDTAAILHVNRTFNRDRGYGERSTVEIEHSGKVEHRITQEEILKELSLEVRQAYLEVMKRKRQEEEQRLQLADKRQVVDAEIEEEE
jgi:hypothetical protein